MSVLRGISFPIKKDIMLKKDTQLFFATDTNKFWFEANNQQITFPRRGIRDRKDSSKLWIKKSKNSSST